MFRQQREFESWVNGWSTDAPTTYQGSEALAFQRWFKFKEAFSPSLVEEVISRMPERPTHVLDCFGGSGTTGIVARLLGIPSTLIEVNPFLADLIEAKFADYSAFNLPLETTRLMDKADLIEVKIATLRERLPPTFVEPGVNERWIFGRSAAKMIEKLRLAIEKVKPLTLKRLFRTALSSILIEASNVRIDGKGRRYRSNWQTRAIDGAEVRARFITAMSAIIEDIAHFPQCGRQINRVLRGDARKAIKEISQPIDLAIFSPPYPNSFDYTDIYNVELWMLGYFETAADNASLRLDTMRSHVQIKWDTPSVALQSKTLRSTIGQLDAVRSTLWNHRIPEMVQAYFEDLDQIIGDVQERLSANGRIVIVVGNSSYAGILIDTNTILDELTTVRGLAIERCESVRVMRSSMQQTNGDRVLDEWLIELKQT